MKRRGKIRYAIASDDHLEFEHAVRLLALASDFGFGEIASCG